MMGIFCCNFGIRCGFWEVNWVISFVGVVEFRWFVGLLMFGLGIRG